MYERYYGLKERPFSLTSNPRYLLPTAQHSEALATLEYCISRRLGIAVLVGEAGTGKTTVIRAAQAALEFGGFVTLHNPLLTRSEFLEELAQGFNLSSDALTSKPRLLLELRYTLEEVMRRGTLAALIVDEAHALPHDILEEVRLLANLETDEEKLLPVVLVGQPELAARLNEPGLRQLKQRVVLRASLGPLTLLETAAYIAGRMQVAGGEASQVFTTEAVEMIHRSAAGLPRTISVICENALVGGFAAREHPITEDTVRQVCRDLDLPVPPPGTERLVRRQDTHPPGRPPIVEGEDAAGPTPAAQNPFASASRPRPVLLKS